MAIYTFHDLTHDTVRKSSLTGIRVSIEHEGQTLIKSDILRLTTYKHGENVRVLLPDGEAV